ncbi:unnamed protein product [Ixodes hexagonus]
MMFFPEPGCQTLLLQETKRLPETTPLLSPNFVRRWNGSGKAYPRINLYRPALTSSASSQ